MNDKNTNNPDSNRRICDRLSLNRRMLLELDSGDILVGESEDISLRGVLLQTDGLFEGDLQGNQGTLYVFGDGGKQSNGFRCRVVRIKGTALALELDKKVVAAFGHYLTNDLFRR